MNDRECYVSAADYERYWLKPKGIVYEGGEPFEIRIHPPILERRVSGISDRRSKTHDRRWEQSRGRRFRLGDRRKTR